MWIREAESLSNNVLPRDVNYVDENKSGGLIILKYPLILISSGVAWKQIENAGISHYLYFKRDSMTEPIIVLSLFLWPILQTVGSQKWEGGGKRAVHFLNLLRESRDVLENIMCERLANEQYKIRQYSHKSKL